MCLEPTRLHEVFVAASKTRTAQPRDAGQDKSPSAIGSCTCPSPFVHHGHTCRWHISMFIPERHRGLATSCRLAFRGRFAFVLEGNRDSGRPRHRAVFSSSWKMPVEMTSQGGAGSQERFFSFLPLWAPRTTRVSPRPPARRSRQRHTHTQDVCVSTFYLCF